MRDPEQFLLGFTVSALFKCEGSFAEVGWKCGILLFLKIFSTYSTLYFYWLLIIRVVSLFRSLKRLVLDYE